MLRKEGTEGLTLRNSIALNARKDKKMRSATPPLRTFLEPLFKKYHRPEFLSSDPLEFVHRFSDPWDQEAVALFSAVLAYGNVRQIRRSVDGLLTRIRELGHTPAGMIRSLSTEKGRGAWKSASASFVHRFNVGSDFYLFSRLIERSWKKHRSLGAHLESHLIPEAEDFGPALTALFSDWAIWLKEFKGEGETVEKSFGYLITSPSLGSTCKRWCMLLRWMVRKDEIDLGLWREGSLLVTKGIRPDQLVMPLDTHTGRISQYIGLTKRKSLNWKAAREITDRLRESDAEDPVKYDFALARLGILDICQRRFRVEICERCDLLRVCRFARKGLSSRASPSTQS